MTRKGLLAEVVDAVASHQQVDWNGCAARATGESRRRIANLRVVATAFAPSADGRPEPVPSARRESSGGRRALGWLLAVALCECVASLAVLPWIWDSYHRLHGFGATYLAVILVGYAGCAAPLLFSRRRDPRAWLLGVYFALMASIPAASILPFFIWGAPPDGEVAYTIYVHPFVLRCAVLWQFTREFPRVHRLTPIDRVARRMVPAHGARRRRGGGGVGSAADPRAARRRRTGRSRWVRGCRVRALDRARNGGDRGPVPPARGGRRPTSSPASCSSAARS